MLVAAPEKGIEEGFEVTRVTLLPFFRASLSDPFKEQEHKDFCVTLKSAGDGSRTAMGCYEFQFPERRTVRI